ncbi:uncharacterized protein BXZ73DRAFT_78209 [Epithele typhae]|uniref:uncharacterized protein n=1 Tax=Epithele typhae TaxID=378194 RepID=UPI0020079A84|nr:uncharacterized protein BXZ73DRAFT_78209 [Epithele typhae]KAH9929059.1 hypothetical protein BXZ73DRAFT_78209 [Epithele typhae]
MHYDMEFDAEGQDIDVPQFHPHVLAAPCLLLPYLPHIQSWGLDLPFTKADFDNVFLASLQSYVSVKKLVLHGLRFLSTPFLCQLSNAFPSLVELVWEDFHGSNPDPDPFDNNPPRISKLERLRVGGSLISKTGSLLRYHSTTLVDLTVGSGTWPYHHFDWAQMSALRKISFIVDVFPLASDICFYPLNRMLRQGTPPSLRTLNILCLRNYYTQVAADHVDEQRWPHLAGFIGLVQKHKTLGTLGITCTVEDAKQNHIAGWTTCLGRTFVRLRELGLLRIVFVSTSPRTETWYGHSLFTRKLAVARDGNLANMIIWDVASAKPLIERWYTPSVDRQNLFKACFSSSSRRLAYVTDSGVDIFSIEVTEGGYRRAVAVGSIDLEMPSGHTAIDAACAWLPDDSQLIVASNSIKVWDTRTLTCTRVISPDTAAVISPSKFTQDRFSAGISISNDGKYLLYQVHRIDYDLNARTRYAETVSTVDLVTGSFARLFTDIPAAPPPSGAQTLSTNHPAVPRTPATFAGPEVLMSPGIGRPVRRLLSRDGARLLEIDVASSHARLAVRDLRAGGAVVAAVELGREAAGTVVEASPDLRAVAVAQPEAGGWGRMAVWCVDEGGGAMHWVRGRDGRRAWGSAAFSEDGEVVAFGWGDGTVSVHRVRALVTGAGNIVVDDPTRQATVYVDAAEPTQLEDAWFNKDGPLAPVNQAYSLFEQSYACGSVRLQTRLGNRVHTRQETLQAKRAPVARLAEGHIVMKTAQWDCTYARSWSANTGYLSAHLRRVCVPVRLFARRQRACSCIRITCDALETSVSEVRNNGREAPRIGKGEGEPGHHTPVTAAVWSAFRPQKKKLAWRHHEAWDEQKAQKRICCGMGGTGVGVLVGCVRTPVSGLDALGCSGPRRPIDQERAPNVQGIWLDGTQAREGWSAAVVRPAVLMGERIGRDDESLFPVCVRLWICYESLVGFTVRRSTGARVQSGNEANAG